MMDDQNQWRVPVSLSQSQDANKDDKSMVFLFD
jgi:hypothetical protein